MLPRRGREALVRVGLVLLGLVLAVLVLEATLQLAAAVVHLTTRATAGRWPASMRRVVCVGDSNVYGLFVGQDHAFPRVLESVWNASATHQPITVLNLGYPGTTTSALRNRLPGILAAEHPDVVLIMVGANDGWLLPEPTADGDVVDPWEWSRVVRLVRLLRRAARPPAIPPPNQHPTRAEHGVFGWTQLVRHNLEAMVTRVRAAGAHPVLLTYPSSLALYGDANVEIRAAARDSRVPLIDLAPIFAVRCPEGKCAELLPDQHPSIAGHVLAARTIAEQLELLALVHAAEPAASSSPPRAPP
jgi:lysophospholipase L1-like esterase